MKSWPDLGSSCRRLLPGAIIACTALIALAADPGADVSYSAVEAYVEIPMPPGFRVESTELDGPVIADSRGRTIYQWPAHKLRNGYSGEFKGKPACFDEVVTVTAGLMSPYPAGIVLPELESRPSCMDLWPPVVAVDGSEAVGKWTILDRDDGIRQWAFDEQPLYTSVYDRKPGDVIGGITTDYSGDAPAYRVPLKPPSRVPPGFAVKTSALGRLLTTHENNSVYAYDGDTATSIACREDCLSNFKPLIAPELARPKGEWSIVERSPGVRQWVFRGRPLYTYVLDQRSWSQEGSDVRGWENVYVQLAPEPPGVFTVQATIAGNVLADAYGMTIYTYQCGDDSIDQLSCDHPNDTQVYRLAMCGGGDPVKCQEHWPYVLAGDSEIGDSRTWSVVRIDPQTGHFATPEQKDALRVWAYRDRPVYTYGLDKRPGDLRGDGTGEWRGQRNGLRAFWLRDDYLRRGMQ